jgi:hypothetical protein
MFMHTSSGDINSKSATSSLMATKRKLYVQLYTSRIILAESASCVVPNDSTAYVASSI